MKNPIIFQKLASAALALLMTVTMSACSDATYDQRSARSNDGLNAAAPDFVIDAPITTDASTNLPAQTPSPIGMEKAIEIVKNHLKDANAVITQRELDDDGVYELEVVSGGIEYDYDVDAFTGKILKIEKDDHHRDTKDPAPNSGSTPISAEKAQQIVKDHLKDPNAIISQLDLDDDGIYELEVVSNGIEYDYDVDAFTGKILKVEKDDRDNDRGDSQTTAQTSSGYISAEQAKQLAREYLNNSSAKVTDCELDDGKYDLEVISGGFEYEFEISATTGKILDVEKDELDN